MSLCYCQSQICSSCINDNTPPRQKQEKKRNNTKIQPSPFICLHELAHLPETKSCQFDKSLSLMFCFCFFSSTSKVCGDDTLQLLSYDMAQTHYGSLCASRVKADASGQQCELDQTSSHLATGIRAEKNQQHSIRSTQPFSPSISPCGWEAIFTQSICLAPKSGSSKYELKLRKIGLNSGKRMEGKRDLEHFQGSTEVERPQKSVFLMHQRLLLFVFLKKFNSTSAAQLIAAASWGAFTLLVAISFRGNFSSSWGNV